MLMVVEGRVSLPVFPLCAVETSCGKSVFLNRAVLAPRGRRSEEEPHQVVFRVEGQ